MKARFAGTWVACYVLCFGCAAGALLAVRAVLEPAQRQGYDEALTGAGGFLLQKIFLPGRQRRTPAQLLVLRIAFAKLPGDLRSGQLHTQVKSVRRVVLQREQRPQRKGIGRTVMASTIEHMEMTNLYCWLADHAARPPVPN